MGTDSMPCPSCGSKRTTEILAADDKPGTIWCHSCGAVTESEARLTAETTEPIDEWSALLQR